MNNKKDIGLIIKVIYYVIVVGLLAAFLISNLVAKNNGSEMGLFDLVEGYVLMIAALAIVLIFAVYTLIDEPKKSIRAMIAFAAIVIVFLIAYSTASTVNPSEIDVTEKYVRFVGGSLTMLYVIGGLSVLSLVGSEIYSLIK